MNISLLTPTRARPHDIERLISSALDTAQDPGKIEFCFYYDDDDYLTRDCLETLVERYPTQIKYCTGPRIILSDTWNRCWEIAQADISMLCADDFVFRSKNWDSLVLEVFDRYEDKLIFVHGNDKVWQERFGTHGFLHRRWVEIVGWFSPPFFSANWNDTWINQLADALSRRVYLSEVIIEHMHVSLKKAPHDATTAEKLERDQRDNNKALFASEEMVSMRSQQISKLRAAMV